MYNIDKYLPDGFFNDLVPQSDLHDLNLDWILHKMRKYETIYYRLNDIINDAVEQKLDELLYNKILSLIGFINVVNPPAPLSGLDRTGASDNSTKLQAMLDQLDTSGDTQCLLYFPSGTYVVSNITVPEGVVFIGECKIDTIISVSGAASNALFKNELSNFTCANISFKGNIQNQSTNLVCFGCPVKDVTLCNVNIMEFYRALDITSNGGQWRADMLDISDCTYGAIKIGTFVRDEFLCYPDYFVDPTTVYNFDKMVIEELRGNVVGSLIINTTDYLTITNMEIQDNHATVMIDDTSNYSTYDFICHTREWERELIKMTGSHMYYNWRGVVSFNETNFIFYKTKSYNIDSAQDVTINTATLSMRSVTKDDYVSGGVYEDYAQQTSTIAGNLHTNVMGSAFIDLEGDSYLDTHNNYDVTVGKNYSKVVSGNETAQSLTRYVNILNGDSLVVGGDKYDSFHANYTMSVTGMHKVINDKMEVNNHDSLWSSSGSVTISAGSLSSDINGRAQLTADSTDLMGGDFKILTDNPLTYRTPTIDGYFGYVPAKDALGDAYKILTDNNSDQLINNYIDAQIEAARGEIEGEIPDVTGLTKRVTTLENCCDKVKSTLAYITTLATDAIDIAGEALSTASSAQQTANSAYAIAGEALSTASSAQQTANSAYAIVQDRTKSGDDVFKFGLTTLGEPGFYWPTGTDTVIPFKKSGGGDLVRISALTVFWRGDSTGPEFTYDLTPFYNQGYKKILLVPQNSTFRLRQTGSVEAPSCYINITYNHKTAIFYCRNHTDDFLFQKIEGEVWGLT